MICLGVYLLPYCAFTIREASGETAQPDSIRKTSARPNLNSYEIGRGGPNESDSSLVANDLMLIVFGYFCKTDLYR